MSHEIVKKITIDKINGKVKICSACNNIRPLSYRYWTIDADTLEEAIGKTMVYIYNGELHISEKDKVNCIWNYALWKATEDIENRKKYIELNYGYSSNHEELKKLYSAFAKVFNSIEIKKGKYVIAIHNDCYIRKTRGRYIYSTFNIHNAMELNNNILAEWFKHLYPSYHLIKLA